MTQTRHKNEPMTPGEWYIPQIIVWERWDNDTATYKEQLGRKMLEIRDHGTMTGNSIIYI